MNENDSEFEGKPHPLTDLDEAKALRDAQLKEISLITNHTIYDWESLTFRHRQSWEALYAKHGIDY